ncbi:MAG TPA: DUF1223 domain-containing protein [Ideonella sp.]|nr:DUF1223 domain-containing protein [Ideonella sp.]
MLPLATLASAAPLECKQAPQGRKIVLAELFSSEGCDSCPPAERAFNGLQPGGELVPLVWHVDYFDGPGWKDRFALAESSRRHLELAQAQGGKPLVATPQVFLDGRAFADWRDARALRSRVLRGAAAEPVLTLWLPRIERVGDALQVQVQVGGSVSPGAVQWRAAWVQSGLSSQVSGGENQGLTLHHQHVVRAGTGLLLAPAPAQAAAARPLAMRLPLPEPAPVGEIGIVVWAQDAAARTLAATWALCPL